jgi:hypothetical protein
VVHGAFGVSFQVGYFTRTSGRLLLATQRLTWNKERQLTPSNFASGSAEIGVQVFISVCYH